MIARSLHAGRPLVLGRSCTDMGYYRICYGERMIVLSEVDAGEVYDITIYRDMVLFTDGGVLDRMLRGALVSAMERFSVPDAHTQLGDALPPEPLPGLYQETDIWGFTTKYGAIVVVPQFSYIQALVRSRDEIDYVEAIEDAPVVVTAMYRVETLAHVLRRHAGDVARAVAEKIGADPGEVERIVARYSGLGHALTSVIDDIVLEISRMYGLGVEESTEIADTIESMVYGYVDSGDYVKPRIIGISLYRGGRFVAGGCDAAREAYRLLPEEDQVQVRSQCRL